MRGNNANLGAWTAQVMWKDDRWGGNDIVLSVNHLPGTAGSDPNIYGLYPGSAESYQVDGNSAIVTGDVVNGFVNFRIGLKSQYAQTANHPARYAVVLFSYANNTKHQKIFLRQGHEADYLIMNGDPISIDGKLTWRNQCRMFPPYNLTAQTMDASVPVRGGKFTDYPTQTGALFQHANPGHPYVTPPGLNECKRWAWNPHTPDAKPAWSPWAYAYLWSTAAAEHETSPVGYRRVYDGYIDKIDGAGDPNRSELRQSLFRSPRTGLYNNSEVSNSVWGYYADGFFDRRPIENGTSVVPGTWDSANVGRLFFNPIPSSGRYNASLFFPAGGKRNYGSGKLQDVGIEGGYLTATVSQTFSVTALMVIQNAAYIYWSDPSNARMIRCVKE
jgi:hypothetical protein